MLSAHQVQNVRPERCEFTAPRIPCSFQTTVKLLSVVAPFLWKTPPARDKCVTRSSTFFYLDTSGLTLTNSSKLEMVGNNISYQDHRSGSIVVFAVLDVYYALLILGESSAFISSSNVTCVDLITGGASLQVVFVESASGAFKLTESSSLLISDHSIFQKNSTMLSLAPSSSILVVSAVATITGNSTLKIEKVVQRYEKLSSSSQWYWTSV
jgi:hypothetical protein